MNLFLFLFLPVFILISIGFAAYFCNKRASYAAASEKKIDLGRNNAENTILEYQKNNTPISNVQRFSSYELRQLLFQEELNKFLKKWYPNMICWKPRNANGVHLKDTFSIYLTMQDGKQTIVNLKNTGDYKFDFLKQEDFPKVTRPSRNPMRLEMNSVTTSDPLTDETDNCQEAMSDESLEKEKFMAAKIQELLLKKDELEAEDKNIFSVGKDYFGGMLDDMRSMLEKYFICIDDEEDGYSIIFM